VTKDENQFRRVPEEDEVRELFDAFTESFQAADQEIDRLAEPLHGRIGLTQAKLAECMAEVMRGEPMDPLPITRKSKKEEVIVGVYNAASLTAPGKSVLVFETDDGVVWQLCDAGPGWSPYEADNANWERVAKFAELLPARINPRPPITEPWSFDLAFGKNGTLKVRPGSRHGEILYSLTRIGRITNDPENDASGHRSKTNGEK
jgi:hypothetical protein